MLRLLLDFDLLSPRESHLVFETARGILREQRQVERERVWTVGVETGETAGKRKCELKKKEVPVIVEGSLEDVEYEKNQ